MVIHGARHNFWGSDIESYGARRNSLLNEWTEKGLNIYARDSFHDGCICSSIFMATFYEQ